MLWENGISLTARCIGGSPVKCMICNEAQLDNHFAEISKLIRDGKFVNLDYGVASKPKTKNQLGFFFAALSGQIRDYLNECGFVVDDKDVRYYLYKKVAEFVPEMVSDCGLFGKEPRIKHLDEMDKELMSKFIDGVFQVLDTEPLFAGAKLTPDVYFNWLNHLTDEEIRQVSMGELPDRDEEYLNFRRSQPCLICGIQHRSQAHHLRDMRLAGMAIKAPDWAAISLCPACHRDIAHGVGFKESLRWIPIDLIVFCRLCYNRWKSFGK